jgi:hypothetical protein
MPGAPFGRVFALFFCSFRSLFLSLKKRKETVVLRLIITYLSLSVFSEERDVDDDEERIIRGRGVHFCFVQRSEPPNREIFIFFVFECIHEKRIFSAPRTQKRRQSGRELSTPIFAAFEARTLLRYAAFCFRFLSSKFRKRRERHQQ